MITVLTEKSRFFSRQINSLTKEVTKELISRKFLSVIALRIDFTKYSENNAQPIFRARFSMLQVQS